MSGIAERSVSCWPWGTHVTRNIIVCCVQLAPECAGKASREKHVPAGSQHKSRMRELGWDTRRANSDAGSGCCGGFVDGEPVCEDVVLKTRFNAFLMCGRCQVLLCDKHTRSNL